MVNRSKPYCMFVMKDEKELLIPPVELWSLNGGTFLLAPNRPSPTKHTHTVIVWHSIQGMMRLEINCTHFFCDLQKHRHLTHHIWIMFLETRGKYLGYLAQKNFIFSNHFKVYIINMDSSLCKVLRAL